MAAEIVLIVSQHFIQVWKYASPRFAGELKNAGQPWPAVALGGSMSRGVLLFVRMSVPSARDVLVVSLPRRISFASQASPFLPDFFAT